MSLPLKLILTALLLSLSLAAPAKGKSGGGGHRSGAKHGKAPSGTGASSSKHRVRGYSKKDGQHIDPHQRSTGNNTQRDNWDTKGNRNPDTGKSGSKDAQR